MTAAPAARQLALPPSAEEMLADAREVIQMLTDQVKTFESGLGHKALKSIYSPLGVCEVTRGHCSPLCVSWRRARDIGEGWIAAYDARGEVQG